jgi:hypothetical protein
MPDRLVAVDGAIAPPKAMPYLAQVWALVNPASGKPSKPLGGRSPPAECTESGRLFAADGEVTISPGAQPLAPQTTRGLRDLGSAAERRVTAAEAQAPE